MIAHILRALFRRFDLAVDRAIDRHVAAALGDPIPPVEVAHMEPTPIADAAWDAHVGDALAVAQSCTCDDWTAEELIALAPDLAELDGVETFADFLYVTGGDVQ